MKRLIVYLFIGLPFLIKAQTPADDPTWQLVFNEEFNTLDRNIWFVQNQFANGGAYETLMLDDPTHVSIQSGNLVLQAQREYNMPCSNYPIPWMCQKSTYNFSGGWVESISQNFSYGYYEFRAKMDLGPGFFPAIWLWMYQAPPHYSEIDIAEMIGYNPYGPGKSKIMYNYIYTSNIHGFDPSNSVDMHPDKLKYYNEININDYSQYHVYGLEWQPNKMIFYLDGAVVGSIRPDQPFDVSMRVIFDVKFSEALALFHEAGPDPVFGLPQVPVLPKRMYVDYFKYYQLKGTCSPAINICNYNFANHLNETKQSYDVGGTGCSDLVSSGPNISFRAKDYVFLKDGFEVPLGSNFYADADSYCNLPFFNPANCGFVFKPCDYDFSSYVNDTKNFIEISGTNCQAIVDPIDNVKLHAVEYINLKEGFSVPIGSEIEIKTKSCP